MNIFKRLRRLWRLSYSLCLVSGLCIAGGLVLGITFLGYRLLQIVTMSRKKPSLVFKNKEVVLFFHSSKARNVSLPIQSVQTWDDLAFTDILMKETQWKVAALRVLSVGELIENFHEGQIYFPSLLSFKTWEARNI